MFFRNILLVIGGLFILLSVVLGYIWLVSPEAPPDTAKSPEPTPALARKAVLTAGHSIQSGTLLQTGDTVWKDVTPEEVQPDNIVRGQVSESEFMGALARRDFREGEALTSSGILKLSDRRFLAAALKPGYRAISVAVDAVQSVSGLLLPGNHVDVILTQNIGGNSDKEKRKTVAETIIRDVRVIAVDQTLNQPKTPNDAAGPTEMRLPRTVTLEVTERQAEMVLVALQLGALELAVRPLDSESGTDLESQDRSRPTWSFDVSPALRQTFERPAVRRAPAQRPSISPLESNIRRPPAL